MSIIEDGTGKGNKAEVDDHGRLYTKANIVSHMAHHATYHKNGYILVFETTLGGSSETPAAFLYNNDANTDYELYWIRGSADANVEMSAYYGNTYTSGGTTLTPVNSNAGAPNSITPLAYSGGASADLVVDTTVNKQVDGGFLGAHQPIFSSYEGGLVLPFQKGITFTVTGTNTDKVKLMLGFAIHTAGTKL